MLVARWCVVPVAPKWTDPAGSAAGRKRSGAAGGLPTDIVGYQGYEVPLCCYPAEMATVRNLAARLISLLPPGMPPNASSLPPQ